MHWYSGKPAQGRSQRPKKEAWCVSTWQPHGTGQPSRRIPLARAAAANAHCGGMPTLRADGERRGTAGALASGKTFRRVTNNASAKTNYAGRQVARKSAKSALRMAAH